MSSQKKNFPLRFWKQTDEHRHAVLTNPNHIYFTSSNKHDYSNIYVDFSPSNWTNVVGLKPAGKGSVFFFQSHASREFCSFPKRLLHF